ncbi:carboxypeptidase regulatory-like domain-containing protein [Pyxidicoccus xibeiensis]|uniref:carboxypeptidase regulatory-like domain-containing protein n=1 Tax=Pyxidicoccus xibeiensis TaxID=2906759 RepID=UPI0020A83851|nr:carboxypeptidase regulatory-like domain-containing protein [Pyxidicoccus xibeiensis]MCP3136666.1 carboxypeptidase regulatory-like domain-containing protein [Pyxidicoccus xibeiensis]
MRTRHRVLGLVVLGALTLLGLWLPRGGVQSRPDAPSPARAVHPRGSASFHRPPPQRTGEGPRLRGTVVDRFGAPVAGARVSATWPEPGQTLSERPCPRDASDSEDTPGQKLADCMVLARDLVLELVAAREGEVPLLAEATTADDGTFVLEGLPEGPLSLWVLSEHGADLRSGIPAGTEGVTLIMGRGRVVEGLVHGEGTPLAEVWVTVFDARNTRFFDATTGADGRFRVGPLPHGDLYVFAAHEGWLPALVPADEAKEVTLHRPRPLTGRVVSGRAPVPGVEVRMRPSVGPPGAGKRLAITDAEGRFTFMLPTDDEYMLTASHDGRYALARVEPGASPPEVLLELGSALHVEGRVSDDARRPVAGARVALYPDGDSPVGLETVTDTEGRYSMGPVEPGSWAFALQADRYVDPPEMLKRTLAPGMGPLDFTLARASAITGNVTDAEGRPVRGVELFLMRSPSDDDERMLRTSTDTDEDGRFVLDAEAPGDFVVEVRSSDHLDANFRVRAPSEDVHLTLRSGASVKGTVVDADGLPLENFLVELLDPELGEEVNRDAMTDAQGRFQLRGVKPGSYVLQAAMENQGFMRRPWREVSLSDGEQAEVELRLAPERSLSGVVVDGSGQPVDGALIRIHPPEEGVPPWKREGRRRQDGPPRGILSGPHGRFTVWHLAEPEYNVAASKDGYDFSAGSSVGGRPVEGVDPLLSKVAPWLRVGNDTLQVRLVMERRVHVSGRLVGPDDAPLQRFYLNGKPVEDPTGAFTLPLKSEEPTRLSFYVAGLPPLMLEVEPRAAGADLDLGSVRMPAARTVRGRVLDAETRAPVEEAHVYSTTRPGNGSTERFLRAADMTDAEGFFELSPVDTSHAFTLHVVAERRYPRRELTVAPGTETLTVLLTQGADVEAPVSGRLPLIFQEAAGGATVKLRAPDVRGWNIFLLPGSVPPPGTLAEMLHLIPLDLLSVKSADEATFLHVPEGRATAFLLGGSENGSRVHTEELDIPASGTESRELQPVWRTIDSK